MMTTSRFVIPRRLNTTALPFGSKRTNTDRIPQTAWILVAKPPILVYHAPAFLLEKDFIRH